VPIRDKLLSEISKTGIFDLVTQQTAADAFLEFKAEMLDPRKPADRLDADKADWVSDVVGFANAQGGDILIGVKADGHSRACGLQPIAQDHAKRLSDQLRDLAIEHITPGIVQLEVGGIEIDAGEWIIIARVPFSPDRPHMSTYNDGTRFIVRVGNRKREMAYDEIQRLFLAGPREQLTVRFLTEIESINSRLSELEKELRKAD
jgi:predicted HTH transcriptional regulator